MDSEQTEADHFADACGALAAVDLRIERADGLILAEGQLDLPCAIIGRDPDCEITLTDPDVSMRHACLQVVGGRVLVADMGSRTGVHGAAGGEGFAWLTPTGATGIGPFQIYLRGPVSAAPTPLDRVPSPFHPSPSLVDRLPKSVLRFLNGRTAKAEWLVNRVMTFVGRAPGCKINLAGDEVASWHCYFLLSPSGMWVVDLLSPTGTWVNGEAVRFSRLRSGDEVQVGRFKMTCEYPNGEPSLPPTDPPTGFRLAKRGTGSSPDIPPHPGVQPPKSPPPPATPTAERQFVLDRLLQLLAVPAAG